MSTEIRKPASTRVNIGNGPYIGKVVSHLDPSYMGSLEVTLLRYSGNDPGDANQTFVVKCASPFYGVTNFSFQGNNLAEKTDGTTAFNDTQKSYGMWFVPPDVGVNVLCFFVNGDPAEGYWMACVPDRFANHMIPAIGGSTAVDISKADKEKYDTQQPLPVAEINKVANDLSKSLKIDAIKKPVHPIADRFLEQGLLEDDIRGVSSSTPRRNLPNMVFGISTPGPLDQRQDAKRAVIGKIQSKTPKAVPVSRLGGTQLIFDDGDDTYLRKKPAGELGQGSAYADVVAGEKGDSTQTIPKDEYFRVRTRTGHQILLHNSEDLIYIGNARGTTWIEMTSNGKIDIYAHDSVSLHTSNDLNIRADRDINLEAGRNINFKTLTGKVHGDIATNFELLVGQDGTITIGNNLDVSVSQNSKQTVGGNYDLRTNGYNRFTAGGDTDIRSAGNHTESAARIDMNGPEAKTAETAATTSLLNTHELPNSDHINTPWAKQRYNTLPISSIMRRMPMHEPWPGHENFGPDLHTPANTDRDVDTRN